MRVGIFNILDAGDEAAGEGARAVRPCFRELEFRPGLVVVADVVGELVPLGVVGHFASASSSSVRRRRPSSSAGQRAAATAVVVRRADACMRCGGV